MLVPVVLAANTSPVAGLASVTVMAVRVGPSSVIVAFAASVMTTGETPFQFDVKPAPAPVPFKSTVGAVLRMAMLMVAVTGVLLSEPSLATTIAVSLATLGPPPVLLYVIVRRTAW